MKFSTAFAILLFCILPAQAADLATMRIFQESVNLLRKTSFTDCRIAHTPTNRIHLNLTPNRGSIYFSSDTYPESVLMQAIPPVQPGQPLELRWEGANLLIPPTDSPAAERYRFSVYIYLNNNGTVVKSVSAQSLMLINRNTGPVYAPVYETVWVPVYSHVLNTCHAE